MFDKNTSKKIEDLLLKSCRKYLKAEAPGAVFPEGLTASLQPTRDPSHGDVASNIAMRVASCARKKPSDIAKGVASIFSDELVPSGLDHIVDRVEEKSGFINIWMSGEHMHKVLVDIKKEGKDYGRSAEGRGKRINIEFVSANPTGPLTIAHGRQAAIGDALARILRFNGYDVDSEYYINDMGRQILLLGRSVEIRYRNLFGYEDPMPEDAYLGDYITDIATQIKDQKGDSLLDRDDMSDGFFRDYAVSCIMGMIKDDLKDFGVSFDVWTAQSQVEADDEVGKTLGELQEKGYIYEKDGARWFSSTALGDDKDRVVVKSDGSYTYLAPDMAYHRDKYRRKYDKIIDILGPDHHGYIKRMKAAVQALGHERDSLEILIVQLVTLLRSGESVSMSTRRGEFISLREIMDEIGRDVTRFFFLSRRLDSHLDFDIDLAKKESADNPVFYIQYAHARICSIKEYGKENKTGRRQAKPRLGLMVTHSERQLMRKLSEFGYAVRSSAESLEPNRLITYLNELARNFHSFYTECRVISEDEDLSAARLFLVECVKTVLSNGLGLLDIALPEKM